MQIGIPTQDVHTGLLCSKIFLSFKANRKRFVPPQYIVIMHTESNQLYFIFYQYVSESVQLQQSYLYTIVTSL
jgi:hypothetical protein